MKASEMAQDVPPPPRSSLHVPAREIPVPTTVSDQGQAFLARDFGDVLEPPATDLAAWRARIAEFDANLAVYCDLVEQQHPVKIHTCAPPHASLLEVTPAAISARWSRRVIYYIHGGAYVMGGGRLAAAMAAPVASKAQSRLYAVDYRMPPDHPYPCGLDDAVEGYRYLLERFAPANIGVYGLSAGGGLAASMVLKARDLGLPLPGALVLHSPEADLTESGDSFETNQYVDIVLKRRLTQSIALYADGHDLRDPYLSAVFGDFTKGFPPTCLASGTRDLFLSNTVILHRAMRRAGVIADLHVFEAMPHSGLGAAPEDEENLQEHVAFMDRHLAT